MDKSLVQIFSKKKSFESKIWLKRRIRIWFPGLKTKKSLRLTHLSYNWKPIKILEKIERK